MPDSVPPSSAASIELVDKPDFFEWVNGATMSVMSSSPKTIRILKSPAWDEAERRKCSWEVTILGLSHESLHVALFSVGERTASLALDKQRFAIYRPEDPFDYYSGIPREDTERLCLPYRQSVVLPEVAQ